MVLKTISPGCGVRALLILIFFCALNVYWNKEAVIEDLIYGPSHRFISYLLLLPLSDHFWVLVPDVLMVMGSEFLVDWVKHAFITKFNEIPDDVSTVSYFILGITWLKSLPLSSTKVNVSTLFCALQVQTSENLS